MRQGLDLSLFGDEGHRYSDDLTEEMSHDETVQYLFSEATDAVRIDELEVAYGILRELVWREPEHSAEAWRMLAKCARHVGLLAQGHAAEENAKALDTE